MSHELVSQLGLTAEPIEKLYLVTWVDGSGMTVSLRCKVEFCFGRSSKELATHDILSMIVGHILLGQPWQHDRRDIYGGYANTDAFFRDGRKIVLRSIRKTIYTATVHQHSSRETCRNWRSYKQHINLTSSVKPGGIMQHVGHFKPQLKLAIGAQTRPSPA